MHGFINYAGKINKNAVVGTFKPDATDNTKVVIGFKPHMLMIYWTDAPNRDSEDFHTISNSYCDDDDGSSTTKYVVAINSYGPSHKKIPSHYGIDYERYTYNISNVTSNHLDCIVDITDNGFIYSPSYTPGEVFHFIACKEPMLGEEMEE